MDTDAFLLWALAAARTLEERYTVELLVEDALRTWHSVHETGHVEPLEVLQERSRQRRLNPAYAPHYDREDLVRAAEVLRDQTQWRPGSAADRPIRNLEALRFLPALVELELPNCEATDLGALDSLPLLESFNFEGNLCEDFSPLTRRTGLRALNLGLGFPWPNLAGIEGLERLEKVTLRGNLLALAPGILWPKVREAELTCTPLPARSMADLPVLPACEFLVLSGVLRLEGIERFETLRNLTLKGAFMDFAPLSTLGRLTWLSVHADLPRDVAPLSRLARLHFLHFYAPKPRDYAPLAEAPALRELLVQGCPPVDTEVAAINAALLPWSDLFVQIPAPQPVARLRMIIAPEELHPHLLGPLPEPSPGELVDVGLRDCESRWVGLHVQGAIGTHLGQADWGTAKARGESRCVFIEIHSVEAAERLPGLLEAAREALAALQAPYLAQFMIALRRPVVPPTPAEALQELRWREDHYRTEFLQWRIDQEEYLERLHRYELKKQEGSPTPPEEFAAPAPPDLPEPEPDFHTGFEDDDALDDSPLDEQADEQADEEDDEEGEAPPEPGWFEDEHPLAEHYRLYGALTLEAAWFLPHHRGLAVHLMGRQPDEDRTE